MGRDVIMYISIMPQTRVDIDRISPEREKHHLLPPLIYLYSLYIGEEGISTVSRQFDCKICTLQTKIKGKEGKVTSTTLVLSYTSLLILLLSSCLFFFHIITSCT